MPEDMESMTLVPAQAPARPGAQSAEPGASATEPPPLRVEGDLAGIGAVVLRGAVDPAMLARLRERAEVLFDLYDELTDAQLQALQAQDYRFHNGLLYRQVDRRFRILEALHPAVMPLLLQFLGVPQLCLRNCILRRLQPERAATRASFHQDLQFLWPHRGPMATLWIPLEPCDGSRPGLQILARRLLALAGPSRTERAVTEPGFRDYADRGGDAAYDAGLALPDATIAALAGGQPLWEPRLAVGDALAFDGLTIHRSALHPGMMAERSSIELRCAPPPEAGAPMLPG